MMLKLKLHRSSTFLCQLQILILIMLAKQRQHRNLSIVHKADISSVHSFIVLVLARLLCQLALWQRHLHCIHSELTYLKRLLKQTVPLDSMFLLTPIGFILTQGIQAAAICSDFCHFAAICSDFCHFAAICSDFCQSADLQRISVF